jgi:hypothetical protein
MPLGYIYVEERAVHPLQTKDPILLSTNLCL